MKKTFCILLCMIILFSVVSPSASAVTESNKYIDSYSAAITTQGSGKITINFSTYGTDYMDDIGASQIELYENGGLVKVYYSSNALYSASMLGHNTWYFYGAVSYNGTAGRTYYAIISHYAGDSTGSDVEVHQTSSVVAS